MANCPKCNAHLKITDWRPECPKCGVNMVYYGMEERLLADAEKAEAEHARFQKKLDRLKASLVGSPFTIARIVCNVLPIGALFLPLAKIALSSIPYVEDKTITVNAIKLYEGVSGLRFDDLFKMFDSALLGSAFLKYLLSIVTILLPVVLLLVQLVRMICSSSKRGCIINTVLGCVGALSAGASIFLFNSFAGTINTVFPTVVSASVGVGAYVFLGLYCLIIAINILLIGKGIPVKYKKIETYADKMAAGMKQAQEAKEKAKAEAESGKEDAPEHEEAPAAAN